MSGYLYAGLAAMMFVASLPNAASARATNVDCNDLGFSFAQTSDAVSVECYRSRRTEASSGQLTDISATLETMFVISHDHVVRITAGAADTGTFFYKEPVRTVMQDFSELRNIEKWGEESDFNHYEIVRFHADFVDSDSECFGFVKYGTARLTDLGYATGAVSFIEGYGCWQGNAPDGAAIETLLDAIK